MYDQNAPGGATQLAQAAPLSYRDDLYSNDFTPINPRQKKPKEPVKGDIDEFEASDWLSIDSTPSPRRAPRVTQSKNDEWALDMGPHDHGEDEPVRLPNGNWACNHKCKDKTRYGLCLVSIEANRANSYSCKHFCCRDGLERPPKPSKKRVLPAPKNESQLTISATIDKKDKQKKEHRGKPVQAKLTKIQATKPDARAGNKTDSGHNGISDNLRLQAEQDKMDSHSKPASSDYGGDALDDLSPAAWLPGDSTSSFAITATSDSPQNEKANYIDLTTPVPQEESLSATSPVSPEISLMQVDEPATVVDEIQSHGIPSEDFAGDWGDLTSEFENDIFTNPYNLTSSATTLPLSTANTKMPRNPNLATGTVQCSSGESSTNVELSHEMQTKEKDAPMHIPVRFTMKDFEDSPSPEAQDSSPGWEDIDRMLMEEFKDIVDFY